MRYVFEAARPILIDLLSTIVFFILLWTTHDFVLATALGIAAGIVEVAIRLIRKKPIGVITWMSLGLVVLMGLACKNAILIVEFAKDQNEAGKDVMEATLLAARQRLRPILMTSLAFGLGVTPLALSSGAGSGGQNAIGIGVLGGVLAATFLGILFVPLFFVLVRKLFGRKATAAAEQPLPAE